jgi:hypothetical protein
VRLGFTVSVEGINGRGTMEEDKENDGRSLVHAMEKETWLVHAMKKTKMIFFFVCCFVCACLNFECGFYVLVFFCLIKESEYL